MLDFDFPIKLADALNARLDADRVFAVIDVFAADDYEDVLPEYGEGCFEIFEGVCALGLRVAALKEGELLLQKHPKSVFMIEGKVKAEPDAVMLLARTSRVSLTNMFAEAFMASIKGKGESIVRV